MIPPPAGGGAADIDKHEYRTDDASRGIAVAGITGDVTLTAGQDSRAASHQQVGG